MVDTEGCRARGKWLKAENGTTVSLAVLTAEPVEVLPRPLLARELAARLRATSFATLAAAARGAGGGARRGLE